LRGSRPVLGEAEGEIPSVYSTLKIRGFSSAPKRADVASILLLSNNSCFQIFYSQHFDFI
jgi:hypothetical protein